MGFIGDLGQSAAGSAIGTALNIGANEFLQKQNYKWGEKAADSAFERQMQLYERQYKDRSPLNIANQLQEAGLNKALMYSGGASGVGGAASGASAPQGHQFTTQRADGINLAITATQLENMKADTALKQSQAAKTTAETGGVTSTIEKVKTEIENIKQQTKNAALSGAMQALQNEIATATKPATIMEASQRLGKLEAETSQVIHSSELTFEQKETVKETRAYIMANYIASIAETNTKTKVNIETVEKLKTEVQTLQQQIDINQFNSETARSGLVEKFGKDIADIILKLLMMKK